MVLNVLGWAKERGFATGPLLTYLSPLLTRQITDGTWNPQCLTNYRSCIKRRTGNYFYQTWAESIEGYTTPFVCSWTDCGDMNHGYGTMATAAATWLLAETGGVTTWNYLNENCRSVASDASKRQNPKWMLIPRPSSEALPPGAYNSAPPRSASASSPARPPSTSAAPSSSSTAPSSGSAVPSGTSLTPQRSSNTSGAAVNAVTALLFSVSMAVALLL